MIREIEFDLETRSPNKIRFSSRAGRMAHDTWIKEQRRKVRAKLDEHFGTVVPTAFVVLGGIVTANQIRVRFTRIAAGTLDPEENLPMAFKHVKDEIAEWCGFKNDRDPSFKWVVPYGQQLAEPHVQRVRIEIVDLSPGEPRRVQLAALEHHERANRARIRSQIKAHDKAKRPTALDQRDAAERCIARKSTRNVTGSAECHGAPEMSHPATPPAQVPLPLAWPSFAALPWEQAPCGACGGAGRCSSGGWPCGVCGDSGRLKALRLAPLPARPDPPETLDVPVPVEHRARYGATVRLTRRRFKSRATGVCWLYETTTKGP